MHFKISRITQGFHLIHEIGVANFMRCNIWLLQGRDFDLVIDTGMGLSSLKKFISKHTDKPLKTIVTHCHFDHSGGLHEFDCRLGHKLEAQNLKNPTRVNTVFEGGWTKIPIVDLKIHPNYSGEKFFVKPAPLTGYIDEGDTIDLGNRHFQILHLPGHSPGSIGLWEDNTKTLFSGDSVYDGALIDSFFHSNKNEFDRTLRRIEKLRPNIVHAGHYDSFGANRLDEIIKSYRKGKLSLDDPEEWFRGYISQPEDYL